MYFIVEEGNYKAMSAIMEFSQQSTKENVTICTQCFLLKNISRNSTRK